MPAMVGDVLGLQGIWMPSGFGVAVAPSPHPIRRVIIHKPRVVELPLAGETFGEAYTEGAPLVLHPHVVGQPAYATAYTEPANVILHEVIAGQAMAEGYFATMLIDDDVEALVLMGIL